MTTSGATPGATTGWAALAEATALDREAFIARAAGRDDLQGLSAAVHAVLGADLPGYRALPGPVQAWLQEGPIGWGRTRRWALTGALIEGLHERLRASAFPPSLWDEWLALAWRARERIRRHPAGPDQAWPPEWEDPWRKDLAALSLRAVPCVSHLVVPGAGVPRSWLLRGVVRQPLPTWRFWGGIQGSLAPYLENHVHLWMLGGFSPEGREACFRRVAQLLRLWPQARGLMGTSWYYDQALAAVSPKLAYLRQVPQAHGALFLEHPPSAQAAHDAAQRAPARRAAIERGAYRPRAVTMVWPRERLLASPWGAAA